MTVAGLAIIGGITAANAAAGDPFPTDETHVWLHQNQPNVATGYPSNLYDLAYNEATGQYDVTFSAGFDSPDASSMAFNPDDGYLYVIEEPGKRSGGSRILRIGQGGVQTVVPGIVTPGDSVFWNQYSGLEYHDGKLWFLSSAVGNLQFISSLDLTTGESKVYAFKSGAYNPNDLVYSNGYFWAASTMSPSGQPNGRLIRYDVTTETGEVWNGSIKYYASAEFESPELYSPVTPGGRPDGYGAAWATGSGLLSFVSNVTGKIVHLRLASDNTVEVVGVGQAPSTANNDGAYSIGAPADIALEKTGPVEFLRGESFEYEISVRNVGGTSSSGWFVKDLLPPGISGAVLVDGPGVTMNTGIEDGREVVYLNGGPLAAGEEVKLRMRVTAANDIMGCVTNTAELIGMEDDPDYGNNTASTDCAQVVTARLDLEKEVSEVVDVNGNGITDPGDTITWQFNVTNTGIANIENIAIRDDLLNAAGIDVDCAPLALAPNESALCESTVPYVITAADATSGSVVNTAVATGNVPEGEPGDPGDVESPEDSTETPVEEPESNVNAAASASASAKADDASNPSAQVAAQAAASPDADSAASAAATPSAEAAAEAAANPDASTSASADVSSDPSAAAQVSASPAANADNSDSTNADASAAVDADASSAADVAATADSSVDASVTVNADANVNAAASASASAKADDASNPSAQVAAQAAASPDADSAASAAATPKSEAAAQAAANPDASTSASADVSSDPSAAAQVSASPAA
ncbi:DUF6923 family protein, partial [Microbacterium sp. NPDC087665]|uniref:DUF6923 family protein n=1 Tax=Microbacterium sp. NPDC087665 TaxID=3364194 RepID=UPI00382AB06B